ncbi:nucleoporin Ndc1 isoform X2 [Agrilus planipennis]|uniref:Nucleoporin Ndc1 isoform X2 n=1 Tax=Agrilus planipennis TaxID=224129 RepID=A0A1W4WGX1_AGRPL|nr:nucleoporin Ndc1 isoform X2 [Agrilus planipennis]
MVSASANCKGIILKKLSSAVVCSILTQIVTLCAFLFVTNINVLHPLEWFKNVLQAVSSINTWLYIFPLASIVFAQSIVNAKDYVAKPIIVLLLLHMMAGFLNIWLYLSLSGKRYSLLYYSNEKNHFCLAEENLFIILSGFWIGFFFFTSYCTREKFIQFPVLQQKKLVQFKTLLFPLFKESRRMATWPAISYFLFCFFCRSVICQTISNILNVIYEPIRLSVTSYIYVWLFTVAYYFFMNLMNLFFKLFLTEEIQFPLEESTGTSISLTVAIQYSRIPIIQHLACLDLYLLSVWSISRRKVLFSLSQPGEHPRYWNQVFASAVKVISQFTKSLNDSVNFILEQPKKEEAREKKTSVTVRHESQAEQNIIVSGHKNFFYQASSNTPKYRNMRNMTLINTEPTIETVQTTYQFPTLVLKQMELCMQMKIKLSGFMTKLKKAFAYDYLFGEITEANVHSLLRSGQLIVWLTQALSNIAVAAYFEDTYGVVQKDLHILIITLLELREGIEKLNRLLMLNKRGRAFKEHSIRMKHNINAAAKRSLCNICLTYKDCIEDLPLNQKVLLQLQHYRQTDESCGTAPGYYKNST